MYSKNAFHKSSRQIYKSMVLSTWRLCDNVLLRLVSDRVLLWIVSRKFLFLILSDKVFEMVLSPCLLPSLLSPIYLICQFKNIENILKYQSLKATNKGCGGNREKSFFQLSWQRLLRRKMLNKKHESFRYILPVKKLSSLDK